MPTQHKLARLTVSTQVGLFLERKIKVRESGGGALRRRRKEEEENGGRKEGKEGKETSKVIFSLIIQRNKGHLPYQSFPAP